MNKIIKTLSTLGSGIILLANTILAHATVPAFGITPTSPTAMLLPANSSAIVQYQVTNQTQISRTLTIQPITGINQINTGIGICPSPFVLAPQQSCLLTLQVNGSQIPPRITGGPVVCKTQGPGNNNPDPFLCSQPETANQLAISVIAAIPPQRAYITNWNGNSISLCTVSPLDGSLSDCATTANGTPFVNPEAITLNAEGTYMYVASIDALNMTNSTVYYCGVDSSSGALSSCLNTGNGFNGADGISINPANTQAYVSNAGGFVSLCEVDVSGALGNCNPTGNGFHIPSDMTLNVPGNKAYVSDLINSVSICSISATNELSCSNTVGGFKAPEGITLHPNGLFAYITNNGDNSISVCKIDVITGNLYSCSTTNGRFDGYGNIAFNNLGTRAYIPQYASSRVLVCSVNLNNGALSLCKDSMGTGFSGPSGILLY